MLEEKIKGEKMKIEENNMMELYKIFVDEEHYFLDEHQKRVAFYIGIITAIMTGIGAGLWKAVQWFHFAIIAFGAFALFIICELAYKGCFRLYQRFLEAIIVRAKLEQYIGFTENINYSDEKNNIYWNGESMIAPRHIDSRLEYKESSKKWQKMHNKKGYQLWTISLFGVIKWISIILFFGCILVSIKQYYNI